MKLWCLMNDIEGTRPARPVLAQPQDQRKNLESVIEKINDVLDGDSYKSEAMYS